MNWTLYILIAGVAATAIWRFAGVFLSSGLSETGAAIAWVKAVSTALVAGLIARIVIFPPGALADLSTPVRLGAFALGVAMYFLARRHMGLGIATGTGVLIAGHLLGF
ncbi:AzlD domain-containing protein [Rhodomicrobium vannielii]|uniref:AzlD domain-containing protein n=1 Tax=Rhodomicrobium vannielii TaxID=1069 RepID=UPI000B4A6C09|nr:AzlD domain-containing protein [Rhodomicrobium vannielii]